MDCSSASITFGGRLRLSRLWDVADACENEGAYPDDDSGGEAIDIVAYIEACAKASQPAKMAANEVPGGEFDELEGLLIELGMGYSRADDGCTWYSPTVELHLPEWGDNVESWTGKANDHDAVMTLGEIRKHLREGTLDKRLTLMEQAKAFAIPIEIVDDTAEVRALIEAEGFVIEQTGDGWHWRAASTKKRSDACGTEIEAIAACADENDIALPGPAPTDELQAVEK